MKVTVNGMTIQLIDTNIDVFEQREKMLYGQAASIVAELIFRCNWRIGLENVLSLLSNDNNIGSFSIELILLFILC